MPLGRIIESPHRASWHETVTGVKASSECRQRRRNGERERERGEGGRWSNEIERRDRDGSVRSDKQSLGRIPLGTKLYSPSRLNSDLTPVGFIHRRSLTAYAFLALSGTPGPFLRLPLFSFFLTFISPSFK